MTLIYSHSPRQHQRGVTLANVTPLRSRMMLAEVESQRLCGTSSPLQKEDDFTTLTWQLFNCILFHCLFFCFFVFSIFDLSGELFFLY